MTRNKQKRIYGLDLARCIALLGMVLVNFRLAMVESSDRTSGWLFSIITALEGKASALFVILAGIGLGISKKDISTRHFFIPHWHAKRSNIPGRYNPLLCRVFFIRRIMPKAAFPATLAVNTPTLSHVGIFN